MDKNTDPAAAETAQTTSAQAVDLPRLVRCFLDYRDMQQCCCNCKHLHPVHYHCCTEPKPTDEQKKAAGIEGRCVCGVQKGWACHNPEMDGRIYDNWPQHSCGCECYDPNSPNT